MSRKNDKTNRNAMEEVFAQANNSLLTNREDEPATLEEQVASREVLIAMLAAIVESSDDAIISKTLDGIITSWNRGAEKIFGYTEEEAIGQHISFIIPAERQSEEIDVLARLRRGEKVDHFETQRQARDGRRVTISLTVSPIKGATGQVVGASKVARDITGRRRTEEALRQSEERLRLLTESFEDYAIVSTDTEGVVQTWNPGAAKIFGYSEDEIIGRPARIIFTPEDRAKGVPEEEMRTARLKGRASDERWHVRKDGSRFYASGVMAPLHDGDALIGYAKIASDLTEQKRYAEELQRAHDELDIRVRERTKELAESNAALLQEMDERKVAEEHTIDLLRKVVTTQEDERRRIARDLHDHLGQRITALRLKIASLRDDCKDNKAFSPRFQRLQEIAERLDSEVSFLAWELRPTALDDLGLVDAVGAFVKEWSRHYETSADFHSTGLSAKRLNQEVETHLYRITQEALNNIIKHAKAKHVTVLLERRAREVILIVEDDGVGFEPGEKGMIRESGTGLGLIGMRERAALIGGNIEIESAPRQGTTIYVRVPAYVDDQGGGNYDL